MKATLHIGSAARQDARGSDMHNFRRFDAARAGNIDTERTKHNLYEGCADLEYYEERFGKWLAQRNAKEAVKHPDRVCTMSKLLEKRVYAPQEMILQIGDKDRAPSAAKLWEAWKDLEKSALFAHDGKPGFAVISAALHVDESTPHMHVRGVWVDGKGEIGMESALRDLGYTRPNPDAPSGKDNCRKIIWTHDAREAWYDAVERQGITLDREPVKGAQHMDVRTYKAVQDMQKKVERAEAELEDMENVCFDTGKRGGLFGLLGMHAYREVPAPKYAAMLEEEKALNATRAELAKQAAAVKRDRAQLDHDMREATYRRDHTEAQRVDTRAELEQLQQAIQALGLEDIVSAALRAQEHEKSLDLDRS